MNFWTRKKTCTGCEHLQQHIDRQEFSLSTWKEMYIKQYIAARGHMKGIERLRRKVAKLQENEQ